ncbi:MAG: hypothetical protein QGG39_11110 [Candidatus Poribacteria bacterium]|nr:hypothetical protein [Candidatus Poribacteria bacterium]MDP7280416.1 hypothetical protein [Candidatus Poribacteria bacterium]
MICSRRAIEFLTQVKLEVKGEYNLLLQPEGMVKTGRYNLRSVAAGYGKAGMRPQPVAIRKRTRCPWR